MVLDHRTHVDVHESRPECCKYVPKSRDRSGRHGDLLVSCSCSLTRSVTRLIPEVCRTFSTYQAILQQKLDHVLEFYLDNVYLEIESVPQIVGLSNKPGPPLQVLNVTCASELQLTETSTTSSLGSLIYQHTLQNSSKLPWLAMDGNHSNRRVEAM